MHVPIKCHHSGVTFQWFVKYNAIVKMYWFVAKWQRQGRTRRTKKSQFFHETYVDSNKDSQYGDINRITRTCFSLVNKQFTQFTWRINKNTSEKRDRPKKNNKTRKKVNMRVDAIWKRHTSDVMIKWTFDNYQSSVHSILSDSKGILIVCALSLSWHLHE